MGNSVRFGVIGCGGMVRNHLATLEGKNPATDPALMPYAQRAVGRGYCDVDKSKAEKHLATYGGAYATDDPERLFSDPEIDAVIIATWHDSHAMYSLKAIEAGKHVLIEKPMCMTEQECDQICGAVAGSGLKYMPAFRTRFAKGSKDVKRHFPQPDNTVAFARVKGIWPERIWAQDPIKGGGQILSQGCHVVDLMFFLAGSEPESVYATGGVFHHSKPRPIDTINAAVRYRNGSVGAFIGGDGGTGGVLRNHYLANNCDFFVLVVDKGLSAIALDHGEAACFESSVPDWKPPYDSSVAGDAEPDRAKLNGLADILPALVKGIVDDTELPANEMDGARTTRFILKCFESARTGQVISF